ncbi:site-specific DNA-methyltransferase [Flavobacterium sp. DG2-3]|uniref:DNA-methyltransferase n=1 Tax=Flavobacterium sp. DG2-3 TaxID=3068317 RepID=UPI00273F24E6|nr:site-specific DNA-methyltransferase [Flavobacterium sp. DG2-3]MDP5198989.1 site-specific DNA-methyltransferase [Flavobacterium sp. DG2-3]
MTNIIQNYILGNAVDTSKIIIKNKLPNPNLIISSPPYYDLINYDDNENQIGHGSVSYEDFLETICDIYHQCYNSATDDATFWLVADTFKKEGERKLFPFDIVNKLKNIKEDTWKLKDIIIWDKEKNLPWNQKGNFKNQHEYILFFTKSDNYKFNIDSVREITDLKKWWKTYPERYNPDGKAPSNVWNFTTPIRGWGENSQKHFCPFPFPLVEKIISISSDKNDFVFDPFAGSGAVLAMANLMERNSAGIDVNADYRDRFFNQVKDGAEKYWIKRKVEIRETSILIKNFKETNNKLRKLKVANGIFEYITKKNNYEFLMYAQDSINNELNLIFYKSTVSPDVNIEDKSLLSLIHQSKIKVDIQIMNESLLLQSIGNEDVFRYKRGKFFAYTSKCSNKKILKSESKYDYIYSNISIKVPNE